MKIGLFWKKKTGRSPTSIPTSTTPMVPVSGWSGWDGVAQSLIYICEACGNQVKQEDHVAVQIGKDNSIYFHKSCYIDPDNQSMIRSLVVAEDVMGI